MQDAIFMPEGFLINTPENIQAVSSLQGLERAMSYSQILEGRAVLCDADHNLIIELPCAKGIIPRREAVLSPADSTTRDIAILTRVGKPVAFKVTSVLKDGTVILSRRAAQTEFLSHILRNWSPGLIVLGRVINIESFGAFVDIGCGIASLMPIDSISVSRISHPKERFFLGQEIKCVVQSIDYDSCRITLSLKELLGTWEQNAASFMTGQTVAGIIRGIAPYGVFVELTPNLTGLAEHKDDIREGQHASVYIKSIVPDKMKIKLVLVDVFDGPPGVGKLRYFLPPGGRLSTWRYSPTNCDKVVEKVF